MQKQEAAGKEVKKAAPVVVARKATRAKPVVAEVSSEAPPPSEQSSPLKTESRSPLARRRRTLASQRHPHPTIHQASPKSGLVEPTPESSTPAPKAKVLSSKRTWTPQSRRVGLIAIKRGMSVMWDEMGIRVPVTVLQVEDNQVLSNILTPRRPGKEPYRAVQIGAKNISPHKVHIGMRGHFRRARVQPKQYVKEFKVSEDAHLPLGMKLSAIHFVPGQYIDAQATTMGKGFQGVMKRWGFSGGTASHGNSLAHRTPGSTGQHQDPGRVWPGKKMPGRMGGKTRTMQNLYVMRVDTSLNLIFVKGNVPGPDDGRTPVYLTDAIKRVQSEALRKQLKTGGDGDWVTVDAAGKPVAPTKGAKDAVKAEDDKTLGIGRGVLGLPFPAGTVAMAKLYPPVLVAPSTRVTSPWVAGDST
ncbi:hypothetical protein M408DRAFT_73162 [Serendipita vermifera MAFF 305830]|uniref:Large ribosomal subunit protein uL3m n=1 Tax=Serendipita vermifera MAFF 305830 TaxID=933852 RepID=A0A0C2XAD1_SERVB|nr:hypothetical protein M408DRAFT_73162 [Serendipita vermifera MAFF 305830]